MLSVKMSVIMPLLVLGGPYSPCFLQKLKEVQEVYKASTDGTDKPEN